MIRRSRRQDLLLGRRQGAVKELQADDISVQQVRDLALVLRKRGTTELRVLARLQSGLLGGPEHTTAFLSTDGALSALIKHVTGIIK